MATPNVDPVPPRPNILWIVTTQWRAQATGYAGDPNARTPNLDALAARSVNYTQAVTPHPFGPFARAALLTGVPSPENGVRDYFDPLPRHTRTVAHALDERGYATAYFGKWHLGERDPAAPLVGEAHARTLVPPEGRGGFAFWEGFESGFLLNDPWLHGTAHPTPIRREGYQSEVVIDRFLNWYASHTHPAKAPPPPDARTHLHPIVPAQSVPWFGVVSVEAPHPPYDAPANGVSRRADAEIVLGPTVPRGGTIESKARHELAGYYAHIEATDRSIGRLLAELPAETIVVFTSVHGDMHGAQGLFRKGWPYEESVRVPFLVRGAPQRHFLDTARSRGAPSVSDRGADPASTLSDRGAGTENIAPVSLIDLPSMSLAWAEGGAWTCSRLDAAISMPSVVALPHQCDRVWRGRRSATRKTIDNQDGTPWLDFDLQEDPLEQRNRAKLR